MWKKLDFLIAIDLSHVTFNTQRAKTKTKLTRWRWPQAQPRQKETSVSKRSSTSVLWNYFGFKTRGCCTALGIVQNIATVASSRGNTTIFFQHLKKHHKALYDNCMAQMATSKVSHHQHSTQQGFLTEMLESVTQYETSSKWHRDITPAITEFLARGMPITMLTKPGFTALINTLDKQYSMPSQTYFSQVAILELYKRCKQGVTAKSAEFV